MFALGHMYHFTYFWYLHGQSIMFWTLGLGSQIEFSPVPTHKTNTWKFNQVQCLTCLKHVLIPSHIVASIIFCKNNIMPANTNAVKKLHLKMLSFLSNVAHFVQCYFGPHVYNVTTLPNIILFHPPIPPTLSLLWMQHGILILTPTIHRSCW